MNKQKMIKAAVIVPSIVVGLFAGSAMARTTLDLSDINGDGAISAEEIKEARQASMASFDTDGNGELSRDERRAMRTAHKEAAVAAYDSDGDGELSREERKLAKQERRAATDVMLDVNGDGEVSAEESAGMEELKSERGDRKGNKRDGKGKRKGKRVAHSHGDDNTEL